MILDEIVSLAEKLIRFRSTTGKEAEVMAFMESELRARKWKVERLPVAQSSAWNVFATAGTPRVILTTHLDVVPGPDFLFEPKISDGKLHGRGACDAKGIAAVMVEAATSLVAEGAKDIGLLFVIEEEATSLGAKAAAPLLKDRGVKFIINGEPTDCCLVTGHKGMLTLELNFAGRSAHSGYPELGDDANAKMFRTAVRLLDADWGSSEKFGKSTINLGVCKGGVATNVISPSAQINLSVRTVEKNELALEKVRKIAGGSAEIIVKGSSELVEMHVVEGFETKSVSFGTDVPHLRACGAQCLLYGPGTITVAHTDLEHAVLAELERSFEGYRRLFKQLSPQF